MEVNNRLRTEEIKCLVESTSPFMAGNGVGPIPSSIQLELIEGQKYTETSRRVACRSPKE